MKTTRRSALKTAAALTSASVFTVSKVRAAEAGDHYIAKNGRINQSFVTWNFRPLTVPELAKLAVKFGVKSIELVGPELWPMLKELGLKCAIAGSHGFAKGFAQPEQHAECLKVLEQRLEQCAAHGVPSVITFSGFRKGLTVDDATKNTIEGLKKIAPVAEKHKVTLCLEHLNYRDGSHPMKGHPGYFGDDVDFCVELIRRVDSPRMKLLFDIYHEQVQLGDVIRTIQQNVQWIGHFHTAGNPLK